MVLRAGGPAPTSEYVGRVALQQAWGGGEGGFAPLARTVEDDLVRAGGEDEGLGVVGEKAQALAGERDGVERVTEIKNWRHWGPGERGGHGGCGRHCREPRG